MQMAPSSTTWQKSGSLPPGIMLASQIPIDFMPYASNPRPPGAPPYERLLLISSRVHDPMAVSPRGTVGI